MNDFNSFFDEFSNKNTIKPNFWLIYAESNTGCSFTSGQLEGYSQYGSLISYSEELEIVNKEYTGEGGIKANNLIIEIPKDSNSVAFYNKFFSKSIMNKIELTEIIQLANKLSQSQKITYTTCKIQNYKTCMNSVVLAVNYIKRQETVTTYRNGAKYGQSVGGSE